MTFKPLGGRVVKVGDMGTQPVPLLENECELLLIIQSRGGGGDLLYLTIVFCIYMH